MNNQIFINSEIWFIWCSG